MYEYLSGKLISKTPVAVVLDANGIGYQIQIPVSTFSSLPEVGQNVRLLIHFVVREDAQLLYGFATDEERHLFRLLISVSGIGPKSAMTVLSGIPLIELKRAIIDGNLVVLTSISGIGRKTAERIIIELREKIVLERQEPAAVGAGKLSVDESLLDDSLQALLELGYKKQNAKEAIQKALKHLESGKFSVSDLIRTSLKYV